MKEFEKTYKVTKIRGKFLTQKKNWVIIRDLVLKLKKSLKKNFEKLVKKFKEKFLIYKKFLKEVIFGTKDFFTDFFYETFLGS